MIVKVFAVYDKKAACYARLIESPTEGLACRNFLEACKNPESELHRHSADFDLYLLGTYNPGNGKMESLANPKWIASAQAMKIKAQEEAGQLPLPEPAREAQQVDGKPVGTKDGCPA